MRTKSITISICLIILFIQSCDYYLGMNQQPDFDDNEFEDGLNIFGLLRPDSLDSFNRSFVFVQQLWPALGYEDISVIQEARVQIFKSSLDSDTQIIDFPMMPPDENFTDTLYRPNISFAPESGETYILKCVSEGFPDAIGRTIIPSSPEIVTNSFSIGENTITFTVKSDTSIKMLDIYFVSGSEALYLKRIVPSEDEDEEIFLSIPAEIHGGEIILYSYDANLATYFGNANTSINFNKYRTTISTLESGYGVFGSLNFTVIPIN